MSVNSSNRICYDNTVFSAGSGINIKELNVLEDWDGRPNSKWSVNCINKFRTKIEKYSYRYHNNGVLNKFDLAQLLPSHLIIQYANDCFGYDGWHMDVLHVETGECLTIPNYDPDSRYKEKFTVQSEAKVKITLKDGTNSAHFCKRASTMHSRGEVYNKSKKEVVTYAMKEAFLNFQNIMEDYELKVETNYFKDGLFGSKT
ncbi:hypothetical protein TPHA_0B00820 [Tetrapisispora phaffii CBS 4417]|uniref:DNA repair protein RAD59 n=1 Tax=Tetrapisispora phaffii (strain ATCC 24235 / CBS 4417 / NBRC 1672 / NRRL Y-8282 / UCD 70-5) TaxID=1071381 RepID=G8BQF7_TETPH|nr:hypothetical protein TPHA_0B00820 [Tetrapisispora phaffii CBS 4417]CCE61754.1 hypothetical protein TPHA_0B00820 [Tetrapisispora phaffii CBS 4417]